MAEKKWWKTRGFLLLLCSYTWYPCSHRAKPSQETKVGRFTLLPFSIERVTKLGMMTDLYGCLGSERMPRLHRSLPALIFFLLRWDVNACLTGVLWELNKGMGFNKYSRWDIPIQFLAYSRYSVSIKNQTLSCMETCLRGHTEWLIALLFKKNICVGATLLLFIIYIFFFILPDAFEKAFCMY